MSQRIDEPTLTRAPAAELGKHLMVKLDGSDEFALCGVGEEPIGPSVMFTDATEKDATAWIIRNKPGTFQAIADGAISQFARVYTAASGKISATVSAFEVGIALEEATADGDVIEILGSSPNPPGGVIAAAVAASTVITNTTAETAFDNASVTIPLEHLVAGAVIKFRASGLCVSTNSTDTLVITVKLGTQIIIATAAIDVVDNDEFIIEGVITIRVAGASGKLVASGVAALDALVAGILVPTVTQELSEDISAAVALACTATWSVASASNQVRCDEFVAEILNV